MSQKKDKEKILFFRESTFKVAELIFNFPNKTFHIRGLAKETELSTTAVVSSVDELHKFCIVKTERTDLTKNIKADLESDAYMFYKKVFNLYRLERYNIVKTLAGAFHPEAIVLFGSFAKGEDIEDSDIDILVITRRKSGENISRFLDKCEKILNRSINLHILPAVDKSPPEFKNAIANGTVLYGYIKVV